MSQDAQARLIAAGDSFDLTASADRSQGDVVAVGALVGVSLREYDSGTNSSLHVSGIFDVVKDNGAIDAGDIVYWVHNGNPQGGTAGSGAADKTSTGSPRMGLAVADAAADDETVRVLLGNRG